MLPVTAAVGGRSIRVEDVPARRRAVPQPCSNNDNTACQAGRGSSRLVRRSSSSSSKSRSRVASICCQRRSVAWVRARPLPAARAARRSATEAELWRGPPRVEHVPRPRTRHRAGGCRLALQLFWCYGAGFCVRTANPLRPAWQHPAGRFCVWAWRVMRSCGRRGRARGRWSAIPARHSPTGPRAAGRSAPSAGSRPSATTS